MAVLSFIHRLNDLELVTKARIRFGSDGAGLDPDDHSSFLYFDTDQSYSGNIIDVRKGGNPAFQVDSTGNVTSSTSSTFSFGAGGAVQFSLSQTPNAHSGLRGLHLNRASTDTLPHGLSLDLDGVPIWDGYAVDATTHDLVLGYSHALQADVLRLRADTAQMSLGPAVGQPSPTGPQLGVFGGTTGAPVPGISVTQNHKNDYGLQLLTGAATSKRTKIVFQGQSTTGFQAGTDSTNNDTDDFWLFCNAAANFPLKVDSSGLSTFLNLNAANLAWSGTLGGVAGSAPRLATATINFTSDADYTLLATEYNCLELDIQAGVISTARNIIVPGTASALWLVRNRNANAVTVKTLAGTGVAVASGKFAFVQCGGTNVLRVTADAS